MTFPFDDFTRGRIAQSCAAFERMPAEDLASGKSLKHAAVAIALTGTADETEFLLTRRASTLRAHGGQGALPGGRCDAGESAVQAALRELDEELGLRLDESSVLGILDDYPTRSGYLITPVVVWAGRDPQLLPNPGEVASVHRIPGSHIIREEAVSFHAIPESERLVVRIFIENNHVNAPTAALLYQFREVLIGRITRVAHYEQPVFAWR